MPRRFLGRPRGPRARRLGQHELVRPSRSAPSQPLEASPVMWSPPSSSCGSSSPGSRRSYRVFRFFFFWSSLARRSLAGTQEGRGRREPTRWRCEREDSVLARSARSERHRDSAHHTRLVGDKDARTGEDLPCVRGGGSRDPPRGRGSAPRRSRRPARSREVTEIPPTWTLFFPQSGACGA